MLTMGLSGALAISKGLDKPFQERAVGVEARLPQLQLSYPRGAQHPFYQGQMCGGRVGLVGDDECGGPKQASGSSALQRVPDPQTTHKQPPALTHKEAHVG
uniref:Uncharacterized protein n=1 Tax=Eutreptiella gymnastica TaxID=73025 RepID=A0A7S1IZQ7_9EUGL